MISLLKPSSASFRSIGSSYVRLSPFLVKFLCFPSSITKTRFPGFFSADSSPASSYVFNCSSVIISH